MRCRVAICGTCCTRLDGVNHCHACLKALAGRREESRPAASLWPLHAALLLAGSGLLLFGLGWLLQGYLAP
jgi:hypothetical protein